MAVVLGGGAVVNVFFRSAQTKSSRLPLQTRPGNPSRGAFWANNNIWFKSFSPSATAWLVAALRAFWALTPRQVNLSWDIDYFINIMIAVFYLNHIQNKFFNLGAADMNRWGRTGCMGCVGYCRPIWDWLTGMYLGYMGHCWPFLLRMWICYK